MRCLPLFAAVTLYFLLLTHAMWHNPEGCKCCECVLALGDYVAHNSCHAPPKICMPSCIGKFHDDDAVLCSAACHMLV